MDLYSIISFLLTIIVFCGYFNYRFLKLPSAIGLTLVAFLLALGATVSDHFFPALGLSRYLRELLTELSFERTLLHWMLGFLLFAGAIHVELDALLDRLKSILSLATLGVLVSAVITGSLLYFWLSAFGHPLPFLWTLIFGVLISPTDPVAVLTIFKSSGVKKETEIVIVGESLLNDGVAVVLFMILFEVLVSQTELHWSQALFLFGQEALGGILLGLILGFVAFLLLKDIDDYELEVLITVTLVMLCYSLAEKFHLSGPLAVVVAGLLIGNHGRRLAMSPKTIEHVDTFWRLTDSSLNAFLFLMVGLEVLLLSWNPTLLALSALSLVVAILARFISVAISLKVVNPLRRITFKQVFFFTWSGLKGGIALALALSLPEGPFKETLLAFAYFNVLFSVIFQGLTLEKVARKFGA